MGKVHAVSNDNLDRFLRLNEQLREATVHSEAQFFAQFKDISILQAHMILTIHFHQPCKMSQIAKSTHLTLGSVTQAIDKLEAKGYVKRVRSSEDRRVVFVDLTTKGQQVVTANEQHVRQVGREAMKKFNATEQKLFLDFFQRMAEE